MQYLTFVIIAALTISNNRYCPYLISSILSPVKTADDSISNFIIDHRYFIYAFDGQKKHEAGIASKDPSFVQFDASAEPTSCSEYTKLRLSNERICLYECTYVHFFIFFSGFINSQCFTGVFSI